MKTYDGTRGVVVPRECDKRNVVLSYSIKGFSFSGYAIFFYNRKSNFKTGPRRFTNTLFFFYFSNTEDFYRNGRFSRVFERYENIFFPLITVIRANSASGRQNNRDIISLRRERNRHFHRLRKLWKTNRLPLTKQFLTSNSIEINIIKVRRS